MRRNGVKHLHFLDDEFRDEALDDIDHLHLSSSKDKFEKAKLLFIKKWYAKKQKTFIEYMNEMWLSTHQNWYEGIAEYTPSQNNGLESHNLVIKKEETFRERMPLSRFLHQSLQAVEKWSKQYETQDKLFVDVPTKAKQVPIGQKRKRGRPKQATKALIID